MKLLRKLHAACVVPICATLMPINPAVAQGGAENVLDTVTLTGRNFAIELNTDGAAGFDLVVPAANNEFIDCVRSATHGLTCIDGNAIRNWRNPVGEGTPPLSETLFSCDNSALPFNTRKGFACTAIDRDPDGALYLGAKQNGTANIVIQAKATPTTSSCETGYTRITGRPWCFLSLASGRPQIEDIDFVKSADDNGNDALLVLEERKTVLKYELVAGNPVSAIVTTIASGKNGFGLNGNEQVLEAALMAFNRPTGAGINRPGDTDTFIVVATDRGRLITINTNGSQTGLVYDLTSLRPAASNCPAGLNTFDVADGPNADLTYAIDGSFCLLHALAKQNLGNGDFAGFADQTVASLPTSVGATSYSPSNISALPGIGFDLDGCSPSCTLISSGADPAAILSQATTVSVQSGVVLFHIKGLPDCAWNPELCFELFYNEPSPGRNDAVVSLIEDNVLYPLAPLGMPLNGMIAPPAEALVRNITPFLPKVVTDQIKLSQSFVPELLLPPEYRAQPGPFVQYLFDALFFVPEPGVASDGVMELEVFVERLTNVSLGCNLAAGQDLGGLVSWDVSLRASERFESPDAIYDPSPDADYQATIVNADCGSTRNRTGGISIFPFNLAVTDCPLTKNNESDWASDCTRPTGAPNPPDLNRDDAVFGKLYVTLYKELRAHLDQTACPDSATAPGPYPFTQSECNQLRAIWDNGQDKLVKALNAVIQPKSSAGSENFGSVQAQLDNYRAKLLIASMMGRSDPANRAGEQEARVDTLDHLLNDKLLPSIPTTGFDEFDKTWAQVLITP